MQYFKGIVVFVALCGSAVRSSGVAAPPAIASLAYQGFIPPSVYPFTQTAATFTRALNVYAPSNIPVGVAPLIQNFAPSVGAVPRAVFPNGIPAIASAFPTAYAAGIPFGSSPYGLEARSIHAVAPGVVPADAFLQGGPGVVPAGAVVQGAPALVRGSAVVPGPLGLATGPPHAIGAAIGPGAVLPGAPRVIPAL